jgi:hypothetical protein
MKLFFDWSSVTVDPQRGIIATTSNFLLFRNRQPAAAFGALPRHVFVPGAIAPSVGVLCTVMTQDFRLPSASWIDTPGVSAELPTSLTTVVDFSTEGVKLGVPFTRELQVNVIETAEDGGAEVDLATSIELVLAHPPSVPIPHQFVRPAADA